MKYNSSQNKYIAYELTRKRSAADDEKLIGVLSEAQVDLNPHQVEAALFAFRSPLSMGAILADEVGLGKTIEAALVISQHWAEGKRNILIIVPATLRKQWSLELEEKFFLPSMILEKRNFDKILNDTYKNPFDQKANIIICSYPFARKQEAHIKRVGWDLVVLDEAHKLRNVYKKNNKTGLALKYALQPFKKVLLTATPLQNDIKELYGLISIIDDNYFGSIDSFGHQYNKVALREEDTYTSLRQRLTPLVHRTLRADVQEYVKYTQRKSLVQVYTPSSDEQALEDIIMDYLRQDASYGLPRSQNQLISMVMLKLMASSTFAIAGTLRTIIDRLQRLIESQSDNQILFDSNTEELYEEYSEEWLDEEDEEADLNDEILSPEQIENVKQEIDYLNTILELALSIAGNNKGECLLTALSTGFTEMESMGAPKKALIFTESTRTQNYLLQLLESNGYQGKVVLFNGSNSDPNSKEIYKAWVKEHQGTSRVTGSMTADKRQALVDYFRNSADIMIATEAAAEGINLQFCSLIVNYDLPWNPQRVEQRIGRCHRYGQRYDVVVVNFINANNRADQRVFELLDQKFKLFKGVFGASDDVLGLAENTVDFERRILSIYRECRTPEQIDAAFDQLQSELKDAIDEKLNNTQASLIENFDEDVVSKLKLRKDADEDRLNAYNRLLWQFTQSMLDFRITVEDSNKYQFTLKRPPLNFKAGRYIIGKDQSAGMNYRISHPLAQYLVRQAKLDSTPTSEVEFNYSSHNSIISMLAAQCGNSGWLGVRFMKSSSLKDDEEYIVSVAIDDNGEVMTDGFVGKLMTVASSSKPTTIDVPMQDSLDLLLDEKCREQSMLIEERNSMFVTEEVQKIENWAEDNRKSLQGKLKQLDKDIEALDSEFVKERNIRKKLAIQQQKDALSSKRDEAWREFDEQRVQLKAEKNKLIENLYALADQQSEVVDSFIIRWRIK
ncbi:MAG: SNF2-related protein [Rikenellaceae bacterium]